MTIQDRIDKLISKLDNGYNDAGTHDILESLKLAVEALDKAREDLRGLTVDKDLHVINSLQAINEKLGCNE